MRTTDSEHAIGDPSASRTPIIQPKIAVGTRLDLSKLVDYVRDHLIQNVPREVIRRKRNSIDRMHANGYFPEMRGKKMLDVHKNSIRETLDFMRTADEVLVAGTAPSSESHDRIVNQCYVDGGYSHLRFNCYLMFRKNIDGKELAYTYPEPLLGEDSALDCAIPADTDSKA